MAKVPKLVLLGSVLVNGVSGKDHHFRFREGDVTDHFGQVSQENLASAMIEDEMLWGRLLGEASFSSSMSMPLQTTCVPPNVPEFIIDEDVDIGDVLIRPGPGFARKCGEDCYLVKDNGDDPPNDPELGDTLRYAYKQIDSDKFSIRSRVCKSDCDSENNVSLGYGRVGVMVRESLDPLAKNAFVSHTPDLSAEWSYRPETGGASITTEEFTPDVPCLWLTLEREGDQFTFSYGYPDDPYATETGGGCGIDPLDDIIGTTVTIDMPSNVLVGLAVSSKTDTGEFCRYTEARFRDIECRGCSA